MSSFRRLFAAILLGGILLSLGCRLRRELPPQPIKIVGASYPLGGAGQSILPSETPFAVSLTGAGDAEMPALALDPLQGRLVAKQVAKQMARRDLARKIEALEVQPGQTVGDIVRGDPDKRRKVEDWIRQAQQKGLIKTAGNKYSVILTLDRRSLAKILDLPGGRVSSAEATTVPLASGEVFRKRAESEAAENARTRALEFVKSFQLQSGRTLGDRMVREDGLDRDIREKVAALTPTSVTFREDGTCEAVVVLDVADIQRVVDKHRKGWRWPSLFYWR